MYDFKITDEPFARGYINAGSNDPYVRMGSGFLQASKEMELVICPITYLPYANFRDIEVDAGLNAHGLERNAEEHPELAEDYLYIIEQFKDKGTHPYFRNLFTEQEEQLMETRAAIGGVLGAHAVPNYVDFAKYGTDGLREKVRHFRELNSDVEGFYDGMLLLLDAIDNIGERFREMAAKEAEAAEDPAVKKKYERIVNTFSHCPKAPAVTFADAVLMFVLVFTLDGVDSPGHFDWYMIDFWRRSDYAESREALEDIWVFFRHNRAWNLCIGGSDENWNDKTNELTYEILDVARKFKFQTPNITMRCHRNTPEKLLREAAKTIGTGIGMPTLYNDEVVCTALERIGISPSDAHEYVMNGCNQIDIQGKSHMGLEDGEVNLGMAVEMTFTRGVGRKTGYKMGPDTGDIAEFDTFEKFYDAVKTHIRFLCDMVCNMANKSQRVHGMHSQNLFRSLTIEGCLERGKDYKNGGPLYGHGQILAEGVPDTADSIAAIKKYVYEEKRFTLTEVGDALAANFEGYPEIYETFRGSKLRFGNDIDYVDEIAKDIVDMYNSYLLTKPTYRGGFYGGGCSPYNRATMNGDALGALPNGKRADEYTFGDSIGATPGNDVKGPTALLASCLKFDHTLPTSGFILNIKFDKKLFNTEKGIEGFLSLYRAYFENKGQQLSVTVVSKEDLLDAMEHPENHENLIVRVGGYSDFFINLPQSLKENVIARTDYEL